MWKSELNPLPADIAAALSTLPSIRLRNYVMTDTKKEQRGNEKAAAEAAASITGVFLTLLLPAPTVVSGRSGNS